MKMTCRFAVGGGPDLSGPAVTALGIRYAENSSGGFHLPPPTVIMCQLLWNFRAVFPSSEAALCSFLNIIVIFRLKSTLFV